MHIYVPGSKILLWNFFEITQLSILNCAHKLIRRFLDFSQFLIAISRKLWHRLAMKLRTL